LHLALLMRIQVARVGGDGEGMGGEGGLFDWHGGLWVGIQVARVGGEGEGRGGGGGGGGGGAEK